VKQPFDRHALNLTSHCGRKAGLEVLARFTHVALQPEQVAAEAVAIDKSVSDAAIAAVNLVVGIGSAPVFWKVKTLARSKN
jgi:hypothetical protein